MFPPTDTNSSWNSGEKPSFSGRLAIDISNSSEFGRGGGLVPTSWVDLTPPEREQSARPGTGTEEGLGLG